MIGLMLRSGLRGIGILVDIYIMFIKSYKKDCFSPFYCAVKEYYQ